MKKDEKKKLEKKKNKKHLIETRVRPNNQIEVELHNPGSTLLGKIFIIVVVAGMTVLGLVGLILLIIQNF